MISPDYLLNEAPRSTIGRKFLNFPLPFLESLKICEIQQCLQEQRNSIAQD